MCSCHIVINRFCKIYTSNICRQRNYQQNTGQDQQYPVQTRMLLFSACSWIFLLCVSGYFRICCNYYSRPSRFVRVSFTTCHFGGIICKSFNSVSKFPVLITKREGPFFVHTANSSLTFILFSGIGSRMRTVNQLFSHFTIMVPPCCRAAACTPRTSLFFSFSFSAPQAKSLRQV